MVDGIEIQVISKLLKDPDAETVEELLKFDESYYDICKDEIAFIHSHVEKYGKVPDDFTFLLQFPDFDIVQVDEPLEFLTDQMRLNKQAILLRETFEKVKDMAADDARTAWKYIGMRLEQADAISEDDPMNLVQDVEKRSEQIAEYARQARIPTGFPEIDEVLYGGFSTVEELCIVFARTNTGKSWICAKMMESAQRHGFPSLFYSPEMQPCYLATRFDSWRAGVYNSDIMLGRYSDEYKKYLTELKHEDTSAYILEDQDSPTGVVDVPLLEHYVRKFGIKLLIIDGLSYMGDVNSSNNAPEHLKFKNVCQGLFKLSKKYHCAVIVSMQANRATRDNTIDKAGEGKEPMPDLYNIESSDHPGRIATTAIALRQCWSTKTMDIQIRKSRNTKRPDTVYTYSWDPNSGYCKLKEEGMGEDSSPSPSLASPSSPSVGYAVKAPSSGFSSAYGSLSGDHDVRDDEDVQF